MKFLLFLIFSITISFFSVAQVSLLTISNDLETPVDSIPWINRETSVKGNAYSGENFSSTDSVRQFGLGYKGAFPAVCRNKLLHIKFSEYVRTNEPGRECEMVVSVSYGDSTVFWESKNVTHRLQTSNTWTKLEDEFDVPASLTRKENNLAIYLWNKDGKAVVDIDDLKIDFEERQLPSFLPRGFTRGETNTGWTKMGGQNSCSFFYNKESGFVRILNSKGDTIINSLALVTEWNDEKSGEKKQSWNYHFYYKKDSTSEDGNYFWLSSRDDQTENEIKIIAGDRKNLTFNLATVFKRPIKLIRQAFIASFSLPVEEVYKKSTLTESESFNREYWLDKEGFRLSNGRSSVLFYRPRKASSVQLDVQNKFAIINMDYCADHPQLHFPLLKKNQNLFEDYSTSVYKKGDSLTSSFTFFLIDSEFKIANMMANPSGYLSAFVWTEHADYTNLRTQRAIYFGSEKLSRLEDATGGFLKYSIPVTKSIFFANPDNVDNSDKSGLMPGPIATFKETEGYKTFLKQLDEFGIEICLHTPDHFTCERKLLGESLDAMRREFAPTTWIDHGYDNSPKSNREDLSCDGFDSKSKWYAADLWKQYNIHYFWNSFYEDSGIFKDYSFNSFFSVPYSGMDDGFPTPVYWRNKTRTGDAIQWRTTSTLDPADGSLWSYFFNDLRLTDLANNRNSIIIHCYPARVDSTTGFYRLDEGVVVADEGFNNALQKLSSYRTTEKIWLTTIRDLLNFRTSIENISYEVTPEGKIRLQNTGKETIRGLSFSTRAFEVKADNKEITSKKSGDELIFWFDMLPGEVMNLTLK